MFGTVQGIMKKIFLSKIRLSWYFIFFVAFYFLILGVLPRVTFEGSALTLFSVNSFLYGFYIAPILSSQKARIDELHKIVRSEANAVFAMALLIKKLPNSTRLEIRKQLDEYLEACASGKLKKAEKEYEDILSVCVAYKGASKDTIEKLLGLIVANQQNRTNLALQLNNKVYSNEWMIMMVLFSITLIFVVLIDAGDMMSIRVVTALLATGISMLMLNLAKLNSLTHKKARQMWQPFRTLSRTSYYRIDEHQDD